MKFQPNFRSNSPLPNCYAADSESAKTEANIRNGFRGDRAGAGSGNIGPVEHGIGYRCHAGGKVNGNSIRNFVQRGFMGSRVKIESTKRARNGFERGVMACYIDLVVALCEVQRQTGQIERS